MIRQFIVIIFLISNPGIIDAQDIFTYLKLVAENNPGIIAYQKLLEARRVEARTGITPHDPVVIFGYMPANSDQAGIKKIWSVNQSFSFPTKYLLQKKLNRSNVILAEHEFNRVKLLILLDARISYLELIYNKKLLNILKTRWSGCTKLQTSWKRMLDSGETTVMDYNKIMLELSSISLEITRREANIELLEEKLHYLSGRGFYNFDTEEYPGTIEPELARLLTDKSAFHPAFLIPETEYQISQEEIKLIKTGSLPEFQIGYSSEIIPGETFTGPTGGLTIPLWANSNRFKTASAFTDHSAAERDATLLKLKSEVKREFANMQALKKSISELKEILKTNGGSTYPDTAVLNGEISVINYFSYLDATYQAEEQLFEIEFEYHKSLSVLMDHDMLREMK